MKYRKKPIVIDAIQWDGTKESLVEVVEFIGYNPFPVHGYLHISTLEGNMRADIGDWIIKGVKGEVYPCKPDIFEQSYELVE